MKSERFWKEAITKKSSFLPNKRTVPLNIDSQPTIFIIRGLMAGL